MSKEVAALPEPEPGVYEVHVFGPEEDGSPEVLFEIPHGATEIEHFEAVKGRLQSDLPAGLEGFFHINTDIGAPEVAERTAELLAARGIRSVLLRSLVPRTFIDCNRALDQAGGGAVTPALPGYIDPGADQELLVDLHRRYTRAAKAAYAKVCDVAGGLAVTLHTYAPRSIALTRVEHSIVEDLRAAYAPGVYATWPQRPEVDLITRTADDRFLASEGLVREVRQRLEGAGYQVLENSTYRLFHVTMGYWHSAARPGRVLCLEMRRDLLAEAFLPFEPMVMDPEKVERLAGPLAEALATAARPTHRGEPLA